jgi:hypothetical protein
LPPEEDVPPPEETPEPELFEESLPIELEVKARIPKGVRIKIKRINIKDVYLMLEL